MMNLKKLQQILATVSDTKVLVLETGSIARTPEIFQQNFPDRPAMIIADEITFGVAGKFIHERFQAENTPMLDPIIFPGTPMLHADYRHIERLREALKMTDAIPVAVGAGTINDLVKRAAYEVGRKYVVVATAASVDGYSSYGAAIQCDGYKKTLECPAPLVIIADSEILRNAPPEMTAAGYADLMSKVPAGADWIIADAVGAEPMQLPIWNMVQPKLRQWVGSPEQLTAGEAQAFEAVFEGLTMTGFAMQAMHNSRPASGADHLFSHIWEMQNLSDSKGIPVSHGFKVALGTLASAALMETVFARNLTASDVQAILMQRQPWEAREADIRRAFHDTPITELVVRESKAKYLAAEQLAARLHLLASCWDELRRKVREQLLPYPELRRMLIAAGCPVTPEQINVTRDRLRETFFLAQMIRTRYTILDLAYDLGRLGECVTEIMTSEIYFR